MPPLSQASSQFIVLASILFSAWYGGFGPGLFTTLVAIMGVHYCLMVPRHSLVISSNFDLLRLILFVVTSVGVVVFASSRQAQARLARANEELSRLTARMETVRGDERARLAWEIHEHVDGSLSILKLDVASLHNRIKHDTTLQNKTNDILKEIDGAPLTVQQIARELRASLLDHHGLAAAIESHLDIHCRQALLDCEKDIDPNVEIKGDHAVAFFRILQEAFTNIIRHAQATKITVHLKQDETAIKLIVTDNGVGLVQQEMLKADALGLIGMRERIRPFGGTVTLAGRPGEGTTVTIVVPISSASRFIVIAKSATTLLPEEPDLS